MKAMILAAGYGKRLRPLTETVPKPLLKVGGKPLLQHHIERLAAVGVTDLVVNIGWLADQIEQYFANGAEFGVNISWSRETQLLETGGGIVKALPLLGDEPFLLINADIWTDFPLQRISRANLEADYLAWLLLVDNPAHHPQGDFSVQNRVVGCDLRANFTFSGVSLMQPALFYDYASQYPHRSMFPLRDVLRPAIEAQLVAGELYHGLWWDVGTEQRYLQLDAYLNQ